MTMSNLPPLADLGDKKQLGTNGEMVQETKKKKNTGWYDRILQIPPQRDRLLECLDIALVKGLQLATSTINAPSIALL